MKLKNQIQWKKETKQIIWTAIVAEKIKNQAHLLRHYELPQHGMLENYITEMELNDAGNREGHAAKVYFNALFGKDFTRNRDNAINAALDYGYSILLSAFNREIVSGGYLTQLGLFHDNMFNQYNLSCDLMEPFRPLVDCRVCEFDFEDFTKEEKLLLIDLLNKELLIDERKNTLLNTIKIYCKSVFASLENDDASQLRFPVMNYEL